MTTALADFASSLTDQGLDVRIVVRGNTYDVKKVLVHNIELPGVAVCLLHDGREMMIPIAAIDVVMERYVREPADRTFFAP